MTTEHTDTISELFRRDPLDWSDSDIDRMIEHLREARKTFLAKPAKGEKAPAIPKEDVEKMSAADLLKTIGL